MIHAILIDDDKNLREGMKKLLALFAPNIKTIKAFRFSALDFLLKPVDPEELQKVIEKIESVIEKKNDFSHIDLLLENIRKNVDNFKRIALSTSDGIHLFDISDIIRCESEP